MTQASNDGEGQGPGEVAPECSYARVPLCMLVWGRVYLCVCDQTCVRVQGSA